MDIVRVLVEVDDCVEEEVCVDVCVGVFEGVTEGVGKKLAWQHALMKW